MKVHIDIETYCELDLKKVGLYKYASHSSFRINCIAWDAGGVKGEWSVHEATKPWERVIRELDLTDATFVAWNANFERVILGQKLHDLLDPKRWECTMVRAGASGLPLQLQKANEALGYSGKYMEGYGEMLLLSKPNKKTGGPWCGREYADKYDRLLKYCERDVELEMRVARKLDSHELHLVEWDHNLYFADQHINDRGVPLDRKLVHIGWEQFEAHRHELLAEAEGTTGLKRAGPEAYRRWLCDNGMPGLENMQSATLAVAKGTPEAKRVAWLYTQANKKAPAKFKAMALATTSGNRVRGTHRFHAAGTGRWSSSIVQFQNIARPPKGVDPDEVIEDLMKQRCTGYIEAIHNGHMMGLLSACVRGAVRASKGNVLVVRDFAQIEARVLAWLARDREKVALFASGADVYKHAASSIYMVSADKITDEQRFVGKTAELALGYGGGKAAFAKMAENLGAPVSEKQAEAIKGRWRATNPHTVTFWDRMENYFAGHARGQFLKVVLKSGRPLVYFRPRYTQEGCSYQGVDTYTRRWQRTKTYGGKLVENVVQATARDLLGQAILKLHEMGAPIIFHVHDEIVLECPEAEAEDWQEKMAEVMDTPPKWAGGLPLDSEGYIAERYRK